LDISKVILTTLDGDTRGGTALSIRKVTGKPIKFTGTGEKLDALEPFYPDRMANRILGMGDLLTLIERAQEEVDEKRAEELAQKMAENRYDFNGFIEQMDQMRNMGPLDDLLKMIPGVGNIPGMDEFEMDEKRELNRYDFNGLIEQKNQMSNMAPLDDLLKMTPSVGNIPGMDEFEMDEKQLDYMKAIVMSMTPAERENPDLLNQSRRRRV